MLVWVVLLIQEVLIRNVNSSLLLCLLLLAVLILQLVDIHAVLTAKLRFLNTASLIRIEHACGLIKGVVVSASVDIRQVLKHVLLCQRLLKRTARTTKRPSPHRFGGIHILGLQPRANGFSLLRSKRVLEVRVHVPPNILSRILLPDRVVAEGRGVLERLLLQRTEV